MPDPLSAIVRPDAAELAVMRIRLAPESSALASIGEDGFLERAGISVAQVLEEVEQINARLPHVRLRCER